MLTANRLRDGDVLYWKGDGWVLDLTEGEVFADTPAASRRWPRRKNMSPAMRSWRPICSRCGWSRAGNPPGEGTRDHSRRRPHASAPNWANSLRRDRPCIGMTSSTPSSWPSAWRNSAARWRAGCPGELTEDQFKPLRLMNGLYLQLHAYMLRVAVPYGTLSSAGRCASLPISRANMTGAIGHFTTRQNIQFNWIKLVDVPDLLAELAPSKCMRSRQAAIACAMSPPTISPAPPRTRSKIPDRWPRSSGNGRACIPNSSSCRANSRSR